VDCTILCSYRGQEEQEQAVKDHASTKHWPDSKHNHLPSLAVDVVPYFPSRPHIRWGDKESSYLFVGFVKGIAKGMGIELRTGADWDGDFDTKDQGLIDLPHFEIKE